MITLKDTREKCTEHDFSLTKQDQECFDIWKSKCQSLYGPLILRFVIHFCELWYGKYPYVCWIC